jgi:hypothetical protein
VVDGLLNRCVTVASIKDRGLCFHLLITFNSSAKPEQATNGPSLVDGSTQLPSHSSPSRRVPVAYLGSKSPQFSPSFSLQSLYSKAPRMVCRSSYPAQRRLSSSGGTCYFYKSFFSSSNTHWQAQAQAVAVSNHKQWILSLTLRRRMHFKPMVCTLFPFPDTVN